MKQGEKVDGARGKKAKEDRDKSKCVEKEEGKNQRIPDVRWKEQDEKVSVRIWTSFLYGVPDT